MRKHKRQKNFVAVLCIIAILIIPCINRAEESTGSIKAYMERGIRAVFDNMHLIYKAYFDDTGNLEEQSGGYVAIEQEWDDDWNLISRTYFGPDANPINRQDGYSTVIWEQNSDGLRDFVFYDTDGNVVLVEKENLTVVDITFHEDGWSDWMMPEYDGENKGITIAKAILGDKQIDDEYLCTIEIEFKGVSVTEGQHFRFWTQGSIDGLWDHWNDNVWNREIVYLEEAPADGVYEFNTISQIKKSTVDSNIFYIGFRCDYWKSGTFRVRNIMVTRID